MRRPVVIYIHAFACLHTGLSRRVTEKVQIAPSFTRVFYDQSSKDLRNVDGSSSLVVECKMSYYLLAVLPRIGVDVRIKFVDPQNDAPKTLQLCTKFRFVKNVHFPSVTALARRGTSSHQWSIVIESLRCVLQKSTTLPIVRLLRLPTTKFNHVV
ncbi:uncharacterized protein BT62DRAFT_334995 [Guyanagaster necrorhizus]|uniref:Uncharacterized protein n=1 Tax=Guyanagaster necrorhizus TaxID=856835 RepID=A0A9P7VNL0_9AGAR|nr:uncharacterized protein BT62DRAFT_334995 [Guyanagaster necrorhizus MCA 3950]KAG7443186.1 hypothetical protein BT62DRAFT_334995 [Guyanagaster necrorhizus MCA 3950]